MPCGDNKLENEKDIKYNKYFTIKNYDKESNRKMIIIYRLFQTSFLCIPSQKDLLILPCHLIPIR